ncbi:MAG: PglZ domain-containing protein [Syntrophobacteraceae bacterium]
MHAFHEYICKHLGDLLKRRNVVVFYDPRAEFAPFVDELTVTGGADGTIPHVAIDNMSVRLARFQGSFFGLRAAVEPFTAVDHPDPLLLYVSGAIRDRNGSILMELEKSGETWEPALKRLSRNVLSQKYTEGFIDGMLAPEGLTYLDIVALLEQTGSDEPPSLLKLIFGSASDGIALLAAWLADESKDEVIKGKEAIDELYALVSSRLGLKITADTPPAKAREKAARYVLVNEFRSNLSGEPPSSVSMIPACPSKDHQERVHKLADRLRKEQPDAYTALADTVETELALAQTQLDPSGLGNIDTFRFEESILLGYCGELIARRDHEAAMGLIDKRKSCFWIARDISRRAQWEACRFMAELGLQVESVKPAMEKCGLRSESWVKGYTAEDGWYRADLTHRSLETWVAGMDCEPEADKALGVVRREYEELLAGMAEGLSKSLRESHWSVPGILHQTQVYSEAVQSGGGRTAFFLVDAMRFEMGVELSRLLAGALELTVKPAIAALPTITSVGMAALLPGASGSFSVVAHKDELVSRIEGTAVASSTDRIKLFKSKVPDMIEMTMGKLLEISAGMLAKALGDASLIVVRSQEIDKLGEGGDDWMARQVMDTVVPNIARAVRKLAGCGIGRFVITADHGFQFSLRKGEDMRMDSPGGATVEIHRRCWVGLGGVTPPGAVRVPGAELGYDTDLDFVFPSGLAVFKSQGGLRYHHGGMSLQEMVVPVVSLRIASATRQKTSAAMVKILNCPRVITNRTFGIDIACDPHIFQRDTVTLRAILVSGGTQVGAAGMADMAVFDRNTGCITMKAGEKVSVGLMLSAQGCASLRVVIQDPATDAVLAQSDELPIKLGIS